MFNIVIFNNKEQEIRDLLLSINEFLNQDILNEYKNLFKVFIVCDGEEIEYKDFLLNITKELNYVVNVKYNRLNNDFAQHKNSIHEYIPENEYIIQLDSDEWVSPLFFKVIMDTLNNDNELDLIYLSRENKVNDITQEYIAQNRWIVDTLQRINFPDWQGRVYKRKEGIQWQQKVHERIVGYKKFLKLDHVSSQVWNDLEDEKYIFTIKHHKNFEKQKSQNSLYERIIENRNQHITKE